MLQNPVLKKLLLAGILLDTQNLKASAPITMTRDAEAVQLLLVGSAPNYRYALFDQLMQDKKLVLLLKLSTTTIGNLLMKVSKTVKETWRIKSARESQCLHLTMKPSCQVQK